MAALVKGFPRWMRSTPNEPANVRQLRSALLAEVLSGECVEAADSASSARVLGASERYSPFVERRQARSA